MMSSSQNSLSGSLIKRLDTVDEVPNVLIKNFLDQNCFSSVVDLDDEDNKDFKIARFIYTKY